MGLFASGERLCPGCMAVGPYSGHNSAAAANMHIMQECGPRNHASALGPHQPGRYSASSLRASRSARSMAAAKSASTVFLVIFPRKKSDHKNSLNGAVYFAK